MFSKDQTRLHPNVRPRFMHDGLRPRAGVRRVGESPKVRRKQVLVDPKPKVDVRKGFCVGNDNTCRARALKGSNLCLGHTRQKVAAERRPDRGERP